MSAHSIPHCSLNEVQFPKELQPPGMAIPGWGLPSLNEVQFPKELQPGKTRPSDRLVKRLNEVQFPKELQRWWAWMGALAMVEPQ